MTTNSEEIRELVDNWILWRDAGDWDRFRTVWRPEGRVFATWFQGTGDEFIKMSREGWERGVSILHTYNGSTIEVAGDRATAQTKMTIAQRAEVDGVLCDVVCSGRFFDFLDRPDGHWGMVLRQPIYERDRIDPVAPGTRLALDEALLARFPEGYRHLAYLQTRIGTRSRQTCRASPGRGPRRCTPWAGLGWLTRAQDQAPFSALGPRRRRHADASGQDCQIRRAR